MPAWEIARFARRDRGVQPPADQGHEPAPDALRAGHVSSYVGATPLLYPLPTSRPTSPCSEPGRATGSVHLPSQSWRKNARPRPPPRHPHSPSPSLSADRLFSQDELDPDQHRRALLSIAEQLGSQLRQRREACRTLTLTVRYADRTSTTKTRTLAEATSHSTALARAAYDLHATYGLERARVRAIALRVHGLSPSEHAHHQLTLDPADDKARRIEAATDRARARFGLAAVKPAALIRELGTRTPSA